MCCAAIQLFNRVGLPLCKCVRRGHLDRCGNEGRGNGVAKDMTLPRRVTGIDPDNFSDGVHDGRAAGPAGDDSIIVELKDETLGRHAVAGYPAALHDLPYRGTTAHRRDNPDLGSQGGHSVSEHARLALG